MKALPGLKQRPAQRHGVRGGSAFVMQYAVIPMSATSRGAFVWPVFLNGLLIHAFGVGPVAVWSVTKGRK